MNIRQALAQSRNIPAIKAYFLAGEEGPILNIAEKMGINFLSKDIVLEKSNFTKKISTPKKFCRDLT